MLGKCYYYYIFLYFKIIVIRNKYEEVARLLKSELRIVNQENIKALKPISLLADVLLVRQDNTIKIVPELPLKNHLKGKFIFQQY